MKKKRKFSLIHLTDVHGYMEAHQEVFWEDGGKTFRLAGGYARISQYLRELRNQHQDNVLVLDGGDTFHGTYLVVEDWQNYLSREGISQVPRAHPNLNIPMASGQSPNRIAIPCSSTIP